MRYFCRITTRWGKSELQRAVRNIREGRLAVTQFGWNVVKSQQFPQKCDTDLLCSLAHVGLNYNCSLMWNMRNVVWVSDVCSSQVAAVKCTTCQLMAFMIWQKVNEFCTTTWEKRVYINTWKHFHKSIMGCGLLIVMHFWWNMPEQVAFQVDAMSRVIKNNFNMLRIEMRVTGTESLGSRALGRKCTDLAMNDYS